MVKPIQEYPIFFAPNGSYCISNYQPLLDMEKTNPDHCKRYLQFFKHLQLEACEKQWQHLSMIEAWQNNILEPLIIFFHHCSTMLFNFFYLRNIWGFSSDLPHKKKKQHRCFFVPPVIRWGFPLGVGGVTSAPGGVAFQIRHLGWWRDGIINIKGCKKNNISTSYHPILFFFYVGSTLFGQNISEFCFFSKDNGALPEDRLPWSTFWRSIVFIENCIT